MCAPARRGGSLLARRSQPRYTAGVSTVLHDACRGQSQSIEPVAGSELTLFTHLPPAARSLPLCALRPLVICDVLLRRLRARGLRVQLVHSYGASAPGSADTSAQAAGELCAALALIAPDRIEDAAPGVSVMAAELDYEAASSGERVRCRLEFTPERQAPALASNVEPEALRQLALATHYRAASSPGELAADTQSPALEEAERRVEYVYRTRERLAAVATDRMVESADVPEHIAEFAQRLLAALDDDLNTPQALSATNDLLKAVNDLAESAKRKQARAGRNALRAAREGLALVEQYLGLGGAPAPELLARIRRRRAARAGIDEADVQRQIDARIEARSRKDFARADSIRDEIIARGIELIDGPVGTHWRIP